MNLQREKLEQAVGILNEEEVDLWLTVGRETLMNPDPVLPLITEQEIAQLGCIAVSRQGKIAVCSGYMDYSGFDAAKTYDEIYMYEKDFTEAFFKLLDDVRPRTIALNYSVEDVAADGLPYGLYLKVMDYLQQYGYDGEVVSAQEIIGKLRGRKSQEELARMKKAVEITETIYEEAKQFLRPGQSQYEIYQFFIDRTRHYGCTTSWQEDQCPLVCLGPDMVFGHVGASRELIAKQGDALTIDFGVEYKGYRSDMQRLYYFLRDDETQAPAEIQKAFEDVKSSVDAAAAILRPGVPGWVVDKAARDRIVELGNPEYGNALGHQVGLKTHDGGVTLAPLWERYKGRNEKDTEQGNVFTLEPNINTSAGLVGQEDMFLVTETGCENLCHRQMEIYLIR